MLKTVPDAALSADGPLLGGLVLSTEGRAAGHVDEELCMIFVRGTSQRFRFALIGVVLRKTSPPATGVMLCRMKENSMRDKRLLCTHLIRFALLHTLHISCTLRCSPTASSRAWGKILVPRVQGMPALICICRQYRWLVLLLVFGSHRFAACQLCRCTSAFAP